jgi:hypothetical protein
LGAWLHGIGVLLAALPTIGTNPVARRRESEATIMEAAARGVVGAVANTAMGLGIKTEKQTVEAVGGSRGRGFKTRRRLDSIGCAIAFCVKST